MKNKSKFMFILALIFLFNKGVCQPDYGEKMYNQLTSANGWKLASQIQLMERKAPKELLATLSTCDQEAVIVFNKDATFKRIFSKGNCSNPKIQDTHGIWSYFSDNDKYIARIKIKDLVDDSYSKDFMVVSISPEYQLMMLIANPNNQIPGNSTVSVFKENDQTLAGAEKKSNVTVSKKPEAKNSNDLISALEIIKSGEFTPWYNPIESYNLNRSLFGVGVLSYELRNQEDAKTNSLMSYKKVDNSGYYLVDIDNDHNECLISVFSFGEGDPFEVTTELLSETILEGLLESGFDFYNDKYFDGELRFAKSSPELVYSLPADNFVTVNPQIYVEVKARVTDGNGDFEEDSRVIGFINFNGKTFEYSWAD